jgi:hypothetical protein
VYDGETGPADKPGLSPNNNFRLFSRASNSYRQQSMHQPLVVSGVNEQAPVVGSSAVDIAEPPELVWAVLTDLERWPSWNPDVKAVSIDGPVAEGSQFRWKTGPGTITSTIRRLEPPRLIAWTGRTLGIKAIHFWWLEPRDAATFVRTEESYDGLVARFVRGPLRKTLDNALESGLRHLKAEAERRARREAERT